MSECDLTDSCAVCGGDVSAEDDLIIYCDRCDIPVHQTCYGVQKVPKNKWFCAPCKQKLATLRCVICKKGGGALKPVLGGGWSHVVCAWSIPEARIVNVETMEPIEINYKRQKNSKQTHCSLCSAKTGITVKCMIPSCSRAIHPLCARDHGRLSIGNSFGLLSIQAYCREHQDANNHPEGMIYFVKTTIKNSEAAKKIRKLELDLSSHHYSGVDNFEGALLQYVSRWATKGEEQRIRKTLIECFKVFRSSLRILADFANDSGSNFGNNTETSDKEEEEDCVSINQEQNIAASSPSLQSLEEFIGNADLLLSRILAEDKTQLFSMPRWHQVFPSTDSDRRPMALATIQVLLRIGMFQDSGIFYLEVLKVFDFAINHSAENSSNRSFAEECKLDFIRSLKNASPFGPNEASTLHRLSAKKLLNGYFSLNRTPNRSVHTKIHSEDTGWPKVHCAPLPLNMNLINGLPDEPSVPLSRDLPKRNMLDRHKTLNWLGLVRQVFSTIMNISAPAEVADMSDELLNNSPAEVKEADNNLLSSATACNSKKNVWSFVKSTLKEARQLVDARDINGDIQLTLALQLAQEKSVKSLTWLLRRMLKDYGAILKLEHLLEVDDSSSDRTSSASDSEGPEEEFEDDVLPVRASLAALKAKQTFGGAFRRTSKILNGKYTPGPHSVSGLVPRRYVNSYTLESRNTQETIEQNRRKGRKRKLADNKTNTLEPAQTSELNETRETAVLRTIDEGQEQDTTEKDINAVSLQDDLVKTCTLNTEKKSAVIDRQESEESLRGNSSNSQPVGEKLLKSALDIKLDDSNNKSASLQMPEVAGMAKCSTENFLISHHQGFISPKKRAKVDIGILRCVDEHLQGEEALSDQSRANLNSLQLVLCGHCPDVDVISNNRR